jgi:glycosyltransferase involved in cell wall biosynthesis
MPVDAMLMREQAGPARDRTEADTRSPRRTATVAPGQERFARRLLRVGVLAPPWVPVPSPARGGVEGTVTALVLGLQARGHYVTLVAAPGSDLCGVRVLTPLTRLPERIGSPDDELRHVVAGAAALRASCDVIIDHSGPMGAYLGGLGGQPVLHVLHAPLGAEQASTYELLAAETPVLRLVATSAAQCSRAPWLPYAGVVHNGVDVARLPFGRGEGGYLAYLGRTSPEGGAVEAIEVARAAGVPLRIAAERTRAEEHDDFRREVRPPLGPDVEWLGGLDPHRKHALLAGARGLIVPTSRSEPLATVMLEAMACGTPVIGMRRGSVPEMVEEGVTGFVRDDVAGLVEAVGRLGGFDRLRCRRTVAERFSLERMVASYERLARAAVLRGPASRVAWEPS